MPQSVQPRRIPLQAISGVSLQEATRLKNGWLALGLNGAAPPQLSFTTAPSNGDAVMFTHKHRVAFQQLFDWLQSVASKNIRERVVAPGSADVKGAGQVGRLDKWAQAAAEKAGERVAEIDGPRPAGRLEQWAQDAAVKADELAAQSEQRKQNAAEKAAERAAQFEQRKQDAAEKSAERAEEINARRQKRTAAAATAAAAAAPAPLRADIQAAADKMTVKFGAGREIRRLNRQLWEGETVLRMTSGAYGKGTGLVVMTDRRLLFVQDGMMSATSEDFPYSKISSVSWQSGMVLGTIVVFASGNKSEIRNVNKEEGRLMTDALRARLADPPAQSAQVTQLTPSPAAAPDVLAQLKQLGELKEAGILSQEEFDAKKVDLLARL